MSNQTEQPDLERRGFIGKTVLAAGAAVVAPGVLVSVAGAGGRKDGADPGKRFGLLIDTNKCAEGCTACVKACNTEHGIDLMQKPEHLDEAQWQQQKPQWIRKVKLQDKLTGKVTNLPMMCQHCEHPPCVDVCPTGASFKRVDGIVMVDRHTCIGCRYCMMACPYKARSFIHQDVEHQTVSAPRGKGCVESCNLCAYRRDEGADNTACAEACEAEGHRAILFGDLNDPGSEIAKVLSTTSSRQIRGDLELNTGVRYTNV